MDVMSDKESEMMKATKMTHAKCRKTRIKVVFNDSEFPAIQQTGNTGQTVQGKKNKGGQQQNAWQNGNPLTGATSVATDKTATSESIQASVTEQLQKFMETIASQQAELKQFVSKEMDDVRKRVEAQEKQEEAQESRFNEVLEQYDERFRLMEEECKHQSEASKQQIRELEEECRLSKRKYEVEVAQMKGWFQVVLDQFKSMQASIKVILQPLLQMKKAAKSTSDNKKADHTPPEMPVKHASKRANQQQMPMKMDENKQGGQEEDNATVPWKLEPQLSL